MVRAVTRRPLVVIAIVAALGIAGGVLALGLEPRAGTDTLVSPSSEVAQATEDFKRDFGDEAVVVLVKGDLQRTVLTPDLGRGRDEGVRAGPRLQSQRQHAAAHPQRGHHHDGHQRPPGDGAYERCESLSPHAVSLGSYGAIGRSCG